MIRLPERKKTRLQTPVTKLGIGFCLLASLAVLTSACSLMPFGPKEDCPTKDPYIRGAITAVATESIRVEENPADLSGTAKAVLQLTEKTRIQRRAGGSALRSDLQVGVLVSAWVTGPVKESYPVQATACAIIIEEPSQP
jgi:hypothetical protein